MKKTTKKTNIKNPAGSIYKISKNISIQINTPDEYTKKFIPKETDFKNINKIKEQVAIAINLNMPILISGETGTGKTSLIRHLAAETSNGFRRVNHNGATTVDDIIGKILINKEGTYWVDGVLVDAMKNGHWYIADEINASSAEILFAYHSLLDDDGYIVLQENGGEVIKPHPNFRFFATMNPSEDYSGVKELNKALMSRFLVIKTDFPSPKTEAEIIMEQTGVSKEVADRMVAFAANVRQMHAKNQTQYVLSTRDLKMWGKLFNIYGKYLITAEQTILNKINPEDREAMITLISLHIGSIDDTKKNKKTNTSTVEPTEAEEPEGATTF